jgi:plasmid maintenance system antidote protein VapI
VNEIHDINTRTKEGRDLTDGEKLREVIENSGISIAFIARKMDCSRNRIYAILNGADCTASEILALADILHLSIKDRNNIFLPINVN